MSGPDEKRSVSEIDRRRHKWLETVNRSRLAAAPGQGSGAVMSVAVNLWQRWNRDVDPFPGVERIASDLGFTARTVRHALGILKAHDFLRDNGQHSSGTIHRALWLPGDGPVNSATWQGAEGPCTPQPEPCLTPGEEPTFSPGGNGGAVKQCYGTSQGETAVPVTATSPTTNRDKDDPWAAAQAAALRGEIGMPSFD